MYIELCGQTCKEKDKIVYARSDCEESLFCLRFS